MRHVLIIKTGAAGDVVLATPMLSALHESYPGIRVTWIVDSSNAPLLEGNPLVARVVSFRAYRWQRHLREWQFIPWVLETYRLRVQISNGDSGPVDAVICCHPDQAIWAALFRGTPVRIALFPDEQIGATQRLYTKVLNRPRRNPPLHNVEHYLLATRALGCADAGEQMLLPETTDEEPFRKEFARQHTLDDSRPLILIAPFTTWENKKWELDRWAQLIEQLVRCHDAQIILTFTRQDSSEISSLLDQISHEARLSVYPAEGTTMRQYVALLRGADVVVSPDSSAMHICAAIGVPAVTLFGPTHSSKIAPRTHRDSRIVYKELPCSPCGVMICTNPVFRACMKQIMVEDVKTAIDSLLLKP